MDQIISQLPKEFQVIIGLFPLLIPIALLTYIVKYFRKQDLWFNLAGLLVLVSLTLYGLYSNQLNIFRAAHLITLAYGCYLIVKNKLSRS